MNCCSLELFYCHIDELLESLKRHGVSKHTISEAVADMSQPV